MKTFADVLAFALAALMILWIFAGDPSRAALCGVVILLLDRMFGTIDYWQEL